MLFCKSKNPKMEEIRAFVPVSSSSDFDSVAPHIANAERDYLVPLIGTEMYERLITFYQTEFVEDLTVAEQKKAELLRLVQSAVIHIAYWIGFDLLNAHITDGGFKRTESTSVKGLFKYQEENLKTYFRTNGFNGLDTVLQYLETNSSGFGEFAASPAFTLLKSAFIPTTDLFNELVFINKSRLTFLRMKPHMQLIEDTEISILLGPTAFALVKSEMVKANPDPKVTALLPYIRKPVAYLASALLMEESGADLTDNGLFFTSTTSGYNNDTERKPSTSERVAVLVKRNRNIGLAYLDQLRSYLAANASDWREVTPSSGKVFRRDNTDKKTFWA
jgi:hypothetical protein